MTPAITIGSYAMPQFVALNLAWCRRLWPEAPLLVSDDLSIKSHEVREVALKAGAAYSVSSSRRSHSMGDVQAFHHAAAFGQKSGRWALKLSQRFIPLDGFQHELTRSATDSLHEGAVAFLPGRIHSRTMARGGLPYGAFGMLTDCVLFNPAVITPEVIWYAHERGYEGHRNNLYAELVWGRITGDHPGKVFPLDWLANWRRPFIYLRKASCNAQDYLDAAGVVGVKGMWDTREWNRIEGKDYQCVPKKIP